MIFNFEVLSLFHTILPGKCQAHAKHGTIQYSLIYLYWNIHTSHARHMPVMIKSKDILPCTCLAWHVSSMAVWISNVPALCPCARPQGVIAMMANSPSLNSLILHHWWHDRNRAEHGMWLYMWALLAVVGTCLACAWHLPVSMVWIKPYSCSYLLLYFFNAWLA